MKIETAKLTGALNRVKPALAGGTTVPAFSHFWFDGESLFAQDGGLGIKLTFESDLECGIIGAPLLALLRNTAHKEVSLEEDEGGVVLSMGRSRSTLPALSLKDSLWEYPTKPEKPIAVDETFIKALSRVLFAEASSPSRVEEHGVMMTVAKNGDVSLGSTDSSTISVASFTPEEDAYKRVRQVLIPRPFCKLLVSLYPKGVKLSFPPTPTGEDEDEEGPPLCFTASDGTVTLYSRVLDWGEAKDVNKVAADLIGEDAEFVPIPDGFWAGIDSALIIAGKDEPLMDMDVAGKKISLHLKSKFGVFEDELELKSKRASTSIYVNASFLSRAKSHVTQVSLPEEGEAAPLIFRSEEDDKDPIQLTYLVSQRSRGEASGKKSKTRARAKVDEEEDMEEAEEAPSKRKSRAADDAADSGKTKRAPRRAKREDSNGSVKDEEEEEEEVEEKSRRRRASREEEFDDDIPF